MSSSSSDLCFSLLLPFSLSIFPNLLSPPSSFYSTLQGSRLPSLGDADDFLEHVDGVFSDERAREGDDSTLYEVPEMPGPHTGKKSKHLGVLYDHSDVNILFVECSTTNT